MAGARTGTVSAEAERSLPSFAFQVWILLGKEAAIELRSKELLLPVVVFAIVALVSFHFAFDLRGDVSPLVAPGILWIAIFFSGMLALGRSLGRETERGSWEGMLVAPLDRGALYLSKALATFLLLTVLEAVLLPVGALFFRLPFLVPGLFLVLPLGTLGVTSVGTLFALMAANTRAREAMLPILLLPLLVPVMVASVKATGGFIDGLSWGEVQPWIGVLVAFDLIFLTLSTLLFDTVTEE
ncbi:MAG: heme exporter protein CcmB [Chloroflexi bacterium]|nr:heme exporter protein CcmB [Chloroflexota bacterium]